MARRPWRHDGPPASSSGWEYVPWAYQGRVDVEPNDNIKSEQARLDAAIDRRAAQRDDILNREIERVERHLRWRRREKTGRS